MIEQIKEKIKNKNLDFTINEEEILRTTPELLIELIELLEKNINLIKEETIKNIFDDLINLNMIEIGKIEKIQK